jgi:hypothetical protein
VGLEEGEKMNETDALIGLLRRKNHSIPLGLRYWLWFKRQILHKNAVLSLFANKKLELEDFAVLIRRLMKGVPTRSRRNKSKKWKDTLTTDMIKVLYRYHKALLNSELDWIVKEGKRGLGVFAKRKFVWTADHSKLLFGIVCGVSADDFAVLCEKKYPSLFTSRNTGDGILFGPACLVNHACDAQLKWTAPTKRGVPELFEGFEALRLKERNPKKAKKGVVFEKNEEITVTYGMSRKDFMCECGKCMQKNN